MTFNPYRPEKCEIIRVEKQTGLDFTYTVASGISPACGQFVELSLPKVGECPISISDFRPGELEMTIRRVGHVTNAIHSLGAGDHLYLRGPYGSGFPVGDFTGKHVIIAAGGTGLAPVKSVINHFFENPALVKSLHLLAGFKSPSDVLFSTDLKRWAEKFKVLLTVDQGDDQWTGNVGLITEFVKDIKIDQPGETVVIVVGPPVMIKFTCREFEARGMDVENIWISMERRMSCGVGKCGHCKVNDSYICLEGPVFNLSGARKLVD